MAGSDAFENQKLDVRGEFPTTLKVLYISGHFSKIPDDEDFYHGINQNILNASRYALIAAKKGWAPFTPHKNTAGFQHVKDIPYEFWMEVCLTFVRKSDAILMLPDWQSSPGATKEHELARNLGIPIYYAENGIPAVT
jgi:hypothetical protein